MLKRSLNMAYPNKTESKMSLIDAVEALSTIVDIDPTSTDYHVLNDRLKRWTEKFSTLPMDGENADIGMIKNIFGTILYHLKNLYIDESVYLADSQKSERVKTIMFLVGEAASKLDRLSGLFHDTKLKSTHELKEFKQLQEFYLNRVARRIEPGLLGKWILGIQSTQIADKPEIEKNRIKVLHTEHVFIDLDGVKKDSEYELFFIRKEDGTRFFDPKLIRSIKLVCDFDTHFKNGIWEDPFADISLLVDRSLNMTAKSMVGVLSVAINQFYHELTTYKQSEMVRYLQNAIMALLLAANSKNILKTTPTKSCFEYFIDFQIFLRKALSTREYQRLIAYPDQALTDSNRRLSAIVNALTHAFYTSKQDMHTSVAFIDNIIHEATPAAKKESVEARRLLSASLNADYVAMGKMIKAHPNGHLKKILEMVESGSYQHYDPLLQHNMPMEMYHLYTGSTKIANLRIPAPVTQENISKVWINEEFKAFIRAVTAEKSKLLIFNFQDKTLWREQARAKVLEDLQKNPEFSNNFIVVTIPKDTEFYHQATPYNKESHADVFMKTLKEQLMNENSGFYFPKEELSEWEDYEPFIDKAIEAIHTTFFQSKNVLTRDQRLDFIELFYFFLELKVLDVYKPNYFSFTCKDAIDTSGAANASFFSCLKLFNQDKLSEKDMEFMSFLIYGIPLTVRERLMLKDRFTRMVSALKVVEAVKSDDSAGFTRLIREKFGPLYETPILESKFNFN